MLYVLFDCLENKVKRIHCTSSGRLNTVLEYIECIKRTCKVSDFKLETSEEQRLDWLDLFGVEFSVPKCTEAFAGARPQ